MNPLSMVPAMAPVNKPQPRTLGLNGRVKAHISRMRGTPRPIGFHPSEMTRLCPVLQHFIDRAREDTLSDNTVTVRAAYAFLRAYIDGRRGNPGLEIEFDAGDYIHDIVRDKLGRIGVLWGVWYCAICGTRMAPGYMPRTHAPDVDGAPVLYPAPCTACNGANLREKHPWRYVETSLTRESELARAYDMNGHMDGDLRVQIDGVTYRYVLEIKSTNEAVFKGQAGVTLPKPEHIAQASVYGWALGISHICFIYVNKNQIHEWKEFIVPVDMDAVSMALAKVQAVRDGRIRGLPPIHARKCKDVRDKEARECPACVACFGMAPPPDFFDRNTR